MPGFGQVADTTSSLTAYVFTSLRARIAAHARIREHDVASILKLFTIKEAEELHRDRRVNAE